MQYTRLKKQDVTLQNCERTLSNLNHRNGRKQYYEQNGENQSKTSNIGK